MTDGRRTALVPAPAALAPTWPGWVYPLRPVDDEPAAWRRIAHLGELIAWWLFDAEWLDRTGRYPLANLGNAPAGILIDPLYVDMLTPSDPVEEAALCRASARILRCCRVPYLNWSDVAWWNAAAQLLEGGWAGSDADLFTVVEGMEG